ncbi:MAG: hypothetical protein R3B48_07935 [Kofleriaceae bacterium]
MATAPFALALALWHAACVVGPSPGDPVPAPDSTELVGEVRDYLTATAVPSAGLETSGLSPELSARGEEDGSFALPKVPPASSFFLRATAEPYYAPVVMTARVDEGAERVRVHLISTADLQRQYATAGLAPDAGTTMVIVHVTDLDGHPVSGVLRSELQLQTADGASVAGQPFAFGPLGDIDPGLASSSAAAGARFAFLGVAPGTYTLRYACAACSPPRDATAPVLASGGASLVKLATTLPADPIEPSADAAFAIFARGDAGGRGCARCHTAGGAASLILDDDAAAVRDRLLAIAGMIVPASPDSSSLLSKPRYETPANHPNATFLDGNDEDYRLLRAWIARGAP